jgi:hypothetical protein
VLENTDLFSTCEKVKSFGVPHTFFLTSQIFHNIPDDIFNSLNDFKVHLNGYDIECNKHFASLISNRISRQTKDSSSNSFIDFSEFVYQKIIKAFFGILQGDMILVDESNIDQISTVLYFLEFDSLSIYSIAKNMTINFALNDISSLYSLPINSIQSIISSYLFSLSHENQLYEFISNLIREDRKKFKFLKYVPFGLVRFSDFISLINSIQLNEFDACLFDCMKCSFNISAPSALSD